MKDSFLALSLLLLLTQCVAQNNRNPMISFDYDKAWKDVSKFESEGLPESALAVVNDIAKHAKAENNAGQLVKAIVHQLKFRDAKEEDAFTKNILQLKQELASSSFPVRPVLHSMLGELYWQYYQANRYEFMNRSETVNFAEDDLSTWSLEKITRESTSHYKLSLEEAEKSKAEIINIYEPVLHVANKLGRMYRPTLYDFLAHRAVDHFISPELNITRPAEEFELDKAEYLSDARTFVDYKVQTKDTLSMKYQAIIVFQELVRLHLDDDEPGAFVDVELKRLKFVKENIVISDNDLYLKALENLERRVQEDPVWGFVVVEKARIFVERGGSYNPLLGDAHKWDLKTAYTLCDGPRAKFPDSDGAILCQNLQNDIRTRMLSAKIEAVNTPGAPFRALITYSNMTDLHYRIIKTTRDEVMAFRKRAEKGDGEYEKRFIDAFLERPFLKSGTYKLPDDGDYQSHKIEVKLDGIAEGEYMVIFSHDEAFTTSDNGIAYAFTTISNIAYVLRNLPDGGTEIFTLHRVSGEALKDVTLSLFSTRYNYKKDAYERINIGTFKSDATGYVKVPYLKSDGNRTFAVDFSKGNDFLSTEKDRTYTHGYYNGSVSQYREGEPRRQIQTFFFLDRAIYRPGQTIYFKGLVVESDGKHPEIKAGYKTSIVLYDANFQEQGTLNVTTNEYGTFNGVFTAPSSGLTGNMSIRNTDDSGEISFSVEEYKRPKFEVTFTPVKSSFRLNDQIKTEGVARAYSGANIDGATVKYSVVRAARFPIWCWYRWGMYPTSPERVLTHGTTTTDANGKFEVDFQAIPDLMIDRALDPTFTYTVHADVTDINGETHSADAYIAVGYKSLFIHADVSDINKDDRNSKKEFQMITSNLAGEFQPAKGNIVISMLKPIERTFRNRMWEQADRHLYTRDEYYKLFPNDLYEDETNIYKWEKAHDVVRLAFDTEKSRTFKIQDLQDWKEGEYVLEMTSQDKDGGEVRDVTYFTVYSPSAKKLATPAVHSLMTLKATGEPGEKASFVVGTSASKVNALYEVERDGTVITKQWVALDDQQRLFEIPITEADRGNFTVHYLFVKDNRLYSESIDVIVPFTNKMLDISFATFRDKLQPGAQEEWKIIVKGKQADKVAAEMVATLYDASLDEFRANSWYASFFNSRYSRLRWSSPNGFDVVGLQTYVNNWNQEHGRSISTPYFDQFNWFGYHVYATRRYKYSGAVHRSAGKISAVQVEDSMAMDAPAEILADKSADVNFSEAKKEEAPAPPPVPKQPQKQDLSVVKARTNFSETAFFYPQLMTNAQGEIIIKFTIPEALTRWKMLGFAHTKDLKSGSAYNQLVTQKDIMVVPNQPRFFRENDKMKFSAKISSLVDKELSGQAQLEFFDALTMKPLNASMKNKQPVLDFSMKPRQSTNLEWSIEIPEGVQAIMYRVVAKAGDFSDGEEMTLPVVTNSMLVTETLPLPVRGNQTKTFQLEKFINNTSTTLRHQRFTLEYTSNPAWYAIQALPYLMEYPYDCVEQTFSKFYANSIATHIANSNPRIKQVFDTWKNVQPDALLSNLEKNQELKSALLEETPWVLQAKDESQRKRMVGVLFDLNRMASEQERALDKIVKAQNPGGGFSWFPGFPSDPYMTQHIVAGMGHLDVMGVKSVRNDNRTWQMVLRAIEFLDNNIQKDYDELKRLAKRKDIKLDDQHLSYFHYHYLYTRSYFKDQAIPSQHKEAFDYFFGQAKKYWVKTNLYTQGMASLALHRYGDKTTASSMIKSFSERALHSDEMGMYWKNDVGYYWYQAPIETQALMIEVYDEVAVDQKSVEELKVWLLKQKQTQDWKTTKATVEACYALLRRGTDALASTKLVDIKVGSQKIDPATRPDTKVEAGTGYFKTAWQASEIKPDMGTITVSKMDDGVAWGAVYWQYFEQLDKITPAETPLKLKKDLFLQQETDRGQVISPINSNTSLKVGDLVKVRIELRVDRTMEYVHMKDMRAAGFEPVSTLSTHKYQDGLYYYESPRDLATNFFIGYLPKGTYVFEYALRVSQKGNFSNGITTIQCMYAPEFSSHSQGIRVDVK